MLLINAKLVLKCDDCDDIWALDYSDLHTQATTDHGHVILGTCKCEKEYTLKVSLVEEGSHKHRKHKHEHHD